MLKKGRVTSILIDTAHILVHATGSIHRALWIKVVRCSPYWKSHVSSLMCSQAEDSRTPYLPQSLHVLSSGCHAFLKDCMGLAIIGRVPCQASILQRTANQPRDTYLVLIGEVYISLHAHHRRTFRQVAKPQMQGIRRGHSCTHHSNAKTSGLFQHVLGWPTSFKKAILLRRLPCCRGCNMRRKSLMSTTNSSVSSAHRQVALRRP